MKMTKCIQLLAIVMAMTLLAGCFALEPAAPPAVEQSATPPVAKPPDTPPTPKPFRSYLNTVSCESLLKSLESKEGQESAMLAIGAFITGSNYAKGRDVNIDLKTLMIMTENSCRQNSKRSLGETLIAIDKSLDRAQSQQKATPLPGAAAVKPATSVAPAPVSVPAPAPRVPAAPATVTKAPAAAPPVTTPAPAAKAPTPTPAKPAAPASTAAANGSVKPVPAAAPAAAPPAATLPKASAGGPYLVQVISTNVEADANRLIIALQKDKFPAFLEVAKLGDKGTWYRVVVGPYEDQPGAEKVAALLRERKFQAMVRLR